MEGMGKDIVVYREWVKLKHKMQGMKPRKGGHVIEWNGSKEWSHDTEVRNRYNGNDEWDQWKLDIGGIEMDVVKWR
jgi:hypothetical protein